MNQMKKLFLALAVAVGLGLLGASEAAAQASCTANSVPTLVRTAGLTELTGSLAFGCDGGVIPAGGASVTVTIQPPAAVITNSTAAGAVPTIKVNGGAAVAASSVAGNTATFAIPAGALASFHIGVHPTDATSVGIRVNVNASGISFPSQIAALITSSPAGVLAITNNVLNVAIPQVGLAATFTNGGGIAQCAIRNLSVSAPSGGTIALGPPVVFGLAVTITGAPSITTVNATEGYPSAFQPVGVAGEGSDSTVGTRLLLRITGLQSNVAVYVPKAISVGTGAYNDGVPGNQLDLQLVTGADASGGTAATPVMTAGDTGLTVLLTTSTVTYEVMDSVSSLLETAPIRFAFFTTGTPTTGTATINVALAPISTVGTASTTAPRPRFADVPLGTANVTVVGCVSNILFPYVVNRIGYDNGFAIANTTTDVFGTTAQAGACTYNFYGVAAPAGGTFTTGSIASGTVDTRLLSILAPGFEGYVIAVCSFQLGHGFNFQVYNLGTSGAVAQGSLGLIIPQPIGTTTRVAAASTAVGPGTGAFAEALGH